MADPVVFMIDVLGTGEEPVGGNYAATVHRIEDGAASLRVTDLAAARGDGVFETLGVIGGHPQSVDAHLARLANSAELLELPEPNIEQWRQGIATAASVLPTDVQGGIKLVLSRGAEGAGRPTAWITASVSTSDYAERRTGIRTVLLDRGYHSEVAHRAPWLLAGAKTLSYAVNMAAQREAVRRGADDAIFITSDGYVMEAPTSTVLLRSGDTFITPRTDIGILPGTSQLSLFAFYQEQGFDAREDRVTVDQLLTADGVWLASSVRLAVAVVQIDGKPIPHDPDMTARMNAALLAREV